MWWLLLSLATGLFIATQGAVAKRYSSGKLALVITWAASAFSLPFFAGYIYIADIDPPELSAAFWSYLAINTALLLWAALMYFKAIEIGELSRDMPLLSLTPIFMMLTSWLLVGQRLTLVGAAAIVVIVLGSFLLQKVKGRRWRDLLAAMLREPGSRRMLGVALIWSITANFDKLCVSEVGPYWYPTLLNASLGIFLLPVAIFGGGQVLNSSRRLFLPLALIGLFQAAAALAQMPAVDVAPHVAYVVALKRGGIMLFGILWGMLLYGERNIRWRLLGASLILVGLLLLAAQAGA